MKNLVFFFFFPLLNFNLAAQWLDLSATEIKGALKYGYVNFHDVVVIDYQFDAADIEALRKALPHCKITAG